MTLFAPLAPRPSAVDACTDAIRLRILRGDLAPGTRLPPERALAASFGVNRVTLRGALARLAASRLLSVRQGSGYVVRDFRVEGGPDLLPGLADIARGDSLADVAADLLLVRRHLARAVLDRLVTGVEPEALAAISATVDRLERSVAAGADLATLAADDLAVLAAIVDATGSAVLRLCFNPVLAVVASLPQLREAIYADAQRSVDAYRLLLAWLADPDEEVIPSLVAALEARDVLTVNWLRAPSALAAYSAKASTMPKTTTSTKAKRKTTVKKQARRSR
jgi:GntR family transcriptional repressor for pyruvate dehydrogenase complex